MNVFVVKEGGERIAADAEISEFMLKTSTGYSKELQLKVYFTPELNARFDELDYCARESFIISEGESRDFYYLGKDSLGYIFQSYR